MRTDRPSQTVLIFSIPAGHGHIKPADALAAAGKQWYPEATVIHRNILELYPGLFSPFYSRVHTILMNHPRLIRRVYSSLERRYTSPSAKKSGSLVNLLSNRRLAAYINAIAPDHIVCTHCLAAEMISDLIGQKKINARLWNVINDFAFHPWWIHEHVSGYFVVNEELHRDLVFKGVPVQNVYNTGLPVMPDFSASHSRVDCAETLGLNPDRFTCLLMAGGSGIGPVLSQVHSLLSANLDFQLICIAGRNSRLLKKLQLLQLQRPHTLFPFGYVTDVSQLMACADMVITKPGGSTVSECIAMGKPMLLVSPAPILEEENAAWLVQRGAAQLVPSVDRLPEFVARLQNNPAELAGFRAAALKCQTPNASHSVLENILT